MVASTKRLKRVEERPTYSHIEPRHHLPLRHPVGRQRIPLEPQQAHALGLLPGQDALDDGRLEQRQSEQFIDRREMQALALGDLAATAQHRERWMGLDTRQELVRLPLDARTE